MPQPKRPFAFLLLLCFTLVFSACTEAKRWLDDKADSKAKPTPLKGDSSTALKTSPAAAQSPKITAAVFSGDLAGKAGKRLLYQLLEKNSKKPIKLDVLLSDEQLEQMHDIDKGKKWYFDLAYQGDDGFATGGELLVDISQGKGDLRITGNHLTGSIIVTNLAGPKQGLMSISAKPASNEPTNARKEDAKPSPSAPTGGKPKQSAANNPPS